MIKSVKAKLVTLLAVVASLFLMGVYAFSVARAATPATFEMLGMSIRYGNAAGDEGIRFGVKLGIETYNELIADDNARAGIIITPADQVSGESLSLWTAKASKAKYGILYNGSNGTNEWSVEGDYAEGIVYIHGFPAASYNRPIVAVAYIDWNDDGNIATVDHSDTVKISMSDVALAIINDYNGSNVNGTTVEQANKLDDYLLDYDVEFLDENGQEISDTQSVKFGEEFAFPETPDDYENRPFIGWQRRVGGTGEPIWSESLIDVDDENLTVKKSVQYKAYFAEKVQYNTTLYNKENIYGGDPSVTYKDGYYYYCSEDADGKLYVLKSASLEELLERGGAGTYGQKTATCVYTPTSGAEFGADAWAPELTYIRGKWYIYVCGVPYGRSGDRSKQRMFVLECKSQDPTGEYKAPVKLTPSGFGSLYAIDGHAFEYKNQLYYVFSGKNGDSNPQLYMCSMSSPTSANNDAVRINPYNSDKLKEGPCTVVDGDNLYLIYSCGTWNGADYGNDDDYHLEYYKLKGDVSTPLSSANWYAPTSNRCLEHGSGVYAVGHNHVFRDADGGLWVSYHGVVGTSDAGTDAYLAKRQVFVQPISIKNGELKFGGIQTAVEMTEEAGLLYNKFDDTEYWVDGYGSGRLWKNYGNRFSVSVTVNRTTTTGDSNADKFCAGVTLYERHGDGNISKLLIGVEKEGNLFFCNYYSRTPYCYKYVGGLWSDRDVINLKVSYLPGSSASNSIIRIDVSNNRDSKSASYTYTLAEINALISDDVKNSDPVNKPFNLHFTGNFEIGLGGNRNKIKFTNAVFDTDVGVAWNDEWGNDWDPYA